MPDPLLNGGKGVLALKAGESVDIPVGKKVHRLHFLGHVFALRYPQDPGNQAIIPLLAKSEVGRYRLNYADGATRDVPIVNRVNASACLFGYPSEQAPFILGGAGGSHWPPSGGICAFTLEGDGREIRSLTVSGSDPNKALFLWAITVETDGEPLFRPVKTVRLGSGHRDGAGIERIAATNTPEAGKSGWLPGAVVRDEATACAFPDDGAIRTLRLAMPADGWYQLTLDVPRANNLVLNAEANGRLAVRSQLLNTEPAFFAEATNGVIDLRLVTRPFSISPSTNAFWTRLRSVQINACQTPPLEIPPPLDLARTLRYGWDAHAEPNIQQGGCLYDQVLRVDLPPGDYRVRLALTHRSYTSPGVRCDVYAQNRQVLDNLSVSPREPGTFDAAAPDGRLTLRIALDPKASTGRIQEWAVERIVLERTR